MFTTLTKRITIIVAGLALAAASLITLGPISPAQAVTLSNGSTLPSSAFSMVDSHGRPARWDPCAPAYWKLYKRGLPKGAYRAIVYAFRQIKAATGISFTYAGAATAAEMAAPPARTIVVGFSSTMPTTRAGVTRSSFAGGVNDSLVILNAQVKINRKVVRRPGARFPEMVPVLLHELGHAVGIGHAHSTREVMNTYVLPLYKYQSADRLKLSAVGAQNGCNSLPA